MDTDDILGKLEGVRRAGSGWTAKCPSHDDNNASLSIGQSDDRLLLYCHAGCDSASVITALGLSWNDLFAEARQDGKRVPIDEYEYRDREGRLVYVVERHVGKSFSQRQLLPSGEWVYSMEGVPRLLYRLPRVLRAIQDGRWVCVVEGEKDVHSLEALGMCATTSSGGSGSWRGSLAEDLTGAKVLILPDNDDPGRKYGEAVAASLANLAHEVRLVNLPVPAKGDVTDWINAGGKVSNLKLLLHEASTYVGGPIRTLASVVPTRVDWLWDKRIPKDKLTIMGGYEGSGKSYLCTVLAARLSNGKAMPDGANHETETLVISYEDDPSDTIRPRAELMGGDLSKLHIWDARMDPFVVPDDMDRLQIYLKAHPKIGLIVLDPLICCLGAVDNYRATDVRRALGHLTALNKTIVGVMHLTKGNEVDFLAHRIAGSHAFTALARSVLLVRNGDIRVVKSNVASPTHVTPLKFDVTDQGFRFVG